MAPHVGVIIMRAGRRENGGAAQNRAASPLAPRSGERVASSSAASRLRGIHENHESPSPASVADAPSAPSPRFTGRGKAKRGRANQATSLLNPQNRSIVTNLSSKAAPRFGVRRFWDTDVR